jgi:hypothetical protein
MYNTDFEEQLKKGRKNLFGPDCQQCLNTREASEKLFRESHPSRPPYTQIFPCYEDENGEYVPFPKK